MSVVTITRADGSVAATFDTSEWDRTNDWEVDRRMSEIAAAIQSADEEVPFRIDQIVRDAEMHPAIVVEVTERRVRYRLLFPLGGTSSTAIRVMRHRMETRPVTDPERAEAHRRAAL